MAPTHETAVPKPFDLLAPTIRVLKELGGSASIEEIDEKVTNIVNLSDEVRAILHHNGPRTEIQYNCAWARSWLKGGGYITNSERGVWSLTPKGDNLKESEFSELPRNVRKASQKTRKSQPAEATVDDELDSESKTEIWREKLLDEVMRMEPSAFERLSQRILRESGFARVLVTGRSGDGGIDGTGELRVNLLSFRVVFQCKRYKGSVGPKDVRDFRGAMTGRSDKSLFITTGTFTSDARKEATRDGVPAIDLIDGDALCTLLKGLKLGVAVKQVEEVEIDPAFFTSI